jgi:hypothetical protein
MFQAGFTLQRPHKGCVSAGIVTLMTKGELRCLLGPLNLAYEPTVTPWTKSVGPMRYLSSHSFAYGLTEPSTPSFGSLAEPHFTYK